MEAAIAIAFLAFAVSRPSAAARAVAAPIVPKVGLIRKHWTENAPVKVRVPRPAGHLLTLPRPRHSRHVLRTHLPARQENQFSPVLAGQMLGTREAGIWLVSIMDSDLGYTDLEQDLATLGQPLRP
jgi:hypothetical protein